ncbi:MAG: CBS domain-containing protein, partial [Clostridia bacterium]|nr:CBS domain-containing protein [Clostridia bacterium]
MNIAHFLTHKSSVAYLYNDFTLRQALEKMKHHGYTAIPVISRDGQYIGTVCEGDFLWYLVRGEGNQPLQQIDVQDVETMQLSDLPFSRQYEPVNITATIDTLIDKAVTQNFVPV